MKKITCIILTIAILFSVNPVIFFQAVSNRSDWPVDLSAPYGGEYFVAFNTSPTPQPFEYLTLTGVNASVSSNLNLQQAKPALTPEQEEVNNLAEQGYSIEGKDSVNGTDLYHVQPGFINEKNYDKASVQQEILQKSTSQISYSYSSGQQKTLSIADIYNNINYALTVNCLYVGTYCTIWVDPAFSGMSASQAQTLAMSLIIICTA